MPYGGGGTDLSLSVPTAPWPASFEAGDTYTAAANTNPFNKSQQVQDWGSRVRELSVSLPPMTQTVATTWINFLLSLNGCVNVFTFSSALCTKYPETLGSPIAPIYWRLKPGSSTRWSIKRGSIYSGFTFELRQAL